jgi:hypothetical protein
MRTDRQVDRKTDRGSDVTQVTGAFCDQAKALNKLSEFLKLFGEITAVCFKKFTKHKTYVLKICKLFGCLLKWHALYNKNQVPKIF